MKSKSLIVLLLSLIVLAAVPASAEYIGNCEMDPNGYAVCGQQCHWQNYCMSNNYPREYYCYYYFHPPGCWHDGTYEECCASKRRV